MSKLNVRAISNIQFFKGPLEQYVAPTVTMIFWQKEQSQVSLSPGAKVRSTSAPFGFDFLPQSSQ